MTPQCLFSSKKLEREGEYPHMEQLPPRSKSFHLQWSSIVKNTLLHFVHNTNRFLSSWIARKTQLQTSTTWHIVIQGQSPQTKAKIFSFSLINFSPGTSRSEFPHSHPYIFIFIMYEFGTTKIVSEPSLNRHFMHQHIIFAVRWRARGLGFLSGN